MAVVHTLLLAAAPCTAQSSFWSLLPGLNLRPGPPFPVQGTVGPCSLSSWWACRFGLQELRSKIVSFLSALLCYRHILSASHFSFLLSRMCGLPLVSSIWPPLWQKHLLSYSSYRGEVKVVVDLHERDVELGDLEDTGGLVGGRVQLLQFELPLQALHGIQGRRLVLLPHQKTRLWGEKECHYFVQPDVLIYIKNVRFKKRAPTSTQMNKSNQLHTVV